tara:strand:+ start:1515 stop:2099 length:585 start_codon:yes stop_codon:yes gene_type:complete
MLKINKYILIIFFFTLPLFAGEMPDDFLKSSVNEISQFISENKDMLENDERYLKAKVNELIIPKFNMTLMAKIVLGKKNWISASNNQRNDFVGAFRDLMVRTYMKSITVFDGDKIEFAPYTPGKRHDIAKVKSHYVTSDGNIAVDYRLKLDSDGKWRVYDVVFDGVSLLKNYRVDFREHIQKDGLDSLINSLKN